MASDLLYKLKSRVEQFQDNIISDVRDIVIENKALIIDMNAENQLYEQGVNNLGVNISDYMPYTDATVEFKKMKGQPYNRVTLRDEGDFHSSFYIDARETEFELKASDWKTEKLTKKYGRQILGLTDENKSELTWSYVFPGILKKGKTLIYGKK